MPLDIKTILSSNPAVFLYFKNESCAPCKVLRVKVEELLVNNFPKIVFHVLDIADYPDLVSEFNVLSSPTMLLFLEGKEYFRGGIYSSISEINNTISKYYDMMFE